MAEATPAETPVPVPPCISNICPTVESVVNSEGDNGVLRESRLVHGVTWATAVLTAFFAVALILWSDQVTSPQWRYLFTFPGGQYSWAAIFAAASACMIVGLPRRWYLLVALGNAALGVGSALVATFYAVAPMLGEGMVTFGWYPWLVALIPSTLGAVIYWRPTRWF